MASYRRLAADKRNLAAWHNRTTDESADRVVDKAEQLKSAVGPAPLGAIKKSETEIIAEFVAALDAEVTDPGIALTYWQNMYDTAPGRTPEAKKLRTLNAVAEMSKLYRKHKAAGKV